MKFAFCIFAFLIGCFSTVFISDQPTDELKNLEPTIDIAEDKPIIPLSLHPTDMTIRQFPFGQTADGQQITKFICQNTNGLTLELIDYGATVTTLLAPDRDGHFENVTLGCTDMAGYEACTSYFGATVGRYCNRIRGARFTIAGKEYSLAANNGGHHLHGGLIGFDKKIWAAETIENDESVGVKFSLTSPDGDQGFPGEVVATVTYLMDNDNQLKIDFRASTDQATHVNLTNHCYWNLSGAGHGKIYDHVMQIESDRVLAVDAESIPTNVYAEVAGSPFDFTSPKKIGQDIQGLENDPLGYDHCFVLRNQNRSKLALAATVVEPDSGRKLEFFTTQPGMQLYTGNYMDGQPGSGGYEVHSGFAIEAQHFPNSPNVAEFPSTLLEPGQDYHHTTVLKFSTVQ